MRCVCEEELPGHVKVWMFWITLLGLGKKTQGDKNDLLLCKTDSEQ